MSAIQSIKQVSLDDQSPERRCSKPRSMLVVQIAIDSEKLQ
jgi:hypothetical protein